MKRRNLALEPAKADAVGNVEGSKRKQLMAKVATMKNSTYPAFVAILLGACSTGEPEQRVAEPHSDASCSLASPPSDLRTIEAHGIDFYIYPATLPAAYNGYQIMWVGDGQNWGSLAT